MSTTANFLWNYMDSNPVPTTNPDVTSAWNWFITYLMSSNFDSFEDAEDVLKVLKREPLADGEIIPGIGFQELTFDLIDIDLYPERNYTEDMVQVGFINENVIIPVTPFANHLEKVLSLYHENT